MVSILDTALDITRAMVHLHSEHIIHSDLKVSRPVKQNKSAVQCKMMLYADGFK